MTKKQFKINMGVTIIGTALFIAMLASNKAEAAQPEQCSIVSDYAAEAQQMKFEGANQQTAMSSVQAEMDKKGHKDSNMKWLVSRAVQIVYLPDIKPQDAGDVLFVDCLMAGMPGLKL